jgi:hypothetical protein
VKGRCLIRVCAVALATISALPLARVTLAHAEEPLDLADAPVVVLPPEKSRIQGLEIDDDRVEMKTVKSGKDAQLIAILHGKFSRDEWSLVHRNQPVNPKKNGSFTVEVPITRSSHKTEFIAIGPLGETEKEVVTLEITEVIKADENLAKPAKPFILSSGLAFSHLSYTETQQGGGAAFSETALTGKVQAGYLLFPPRWDVSASAYLTLLPFSNTVSNSVRFFGLNLRAGYSPSFVAIPWKLTLNFGYYFLTSLVNPPDFGFSDVGGPQLYPTLRRFFKRGDSALIYFKYSPVANHFQVLSTTSREIAMGLAYTRPVGRAYSWSATLDISNLQLDLPDENQYMMKLNTVSLGFGLGF